jgi:hypothetical protein
MAPGVDRICRVPRVYQPGWWLLWGAAAGELGYFGGRPAT